jgi:hypothetical protein
MQGVAIAPVLPGVNFLYRVANVISYLILFAYLAAGFYRRDRHKIKAVGLS